MKLYPEHKHNKQKGKLSKMKTTKREFDEIVLGLAKENPDITLSEQELLMQANAWSIRNGGFSGRVAEQFIIHLKSPLYNFFKNQKIVEKIIIDIY